MLLDDSGVLYETEVPDMKWMYVQQLRRNAKRLHMLMFQCIWCKLITATLAW